MAAIDGDDLVITVTERYIVGGPTKRYSRGTMDIVGTGTYTTGGISLAKISPAVPAHKRFGMDRQLDEVRIVGSLVDSNPGTSSVTDFDYKFNPVTKALVLYVSDDTDLDDEVGTGVAPGPRRLHWQANGW